VSHRLEQLWAGWRSSYVSGDVPAVPVPPGEGTIFERILTCGLSDRETYVLARGEYCAAILNIYPYGTGHMLVMPQRAVPDLLDLADEAHDELWTMVRDGVSAIRAAYSPDGVNVGANLGRAGGASIPDHLHVHCLPRWTGDSTFLTAIAEARMLPEPLDTTWEKLRASWPGDRSG
jgi:ATP adenylyltransferase